MDQYEPLKLENPQTRMHITQSISAKQLSITYIPPLLWSVKPRV